NSRRVAGNRRFSPWNVVHIPIPPDLCYACEVWIQSCYGERLGHLVYTVKPRSFRSHAESDFLPPHGFDSFCRCPVCLQMETSPAISEKHWNRDDLDKVRGVRHPWGSCRRRLGLLQPSPRNDRRGDLGCDSSNILLNLNLHPLL